MRLLLLLALSLAPLPLSHGQAKLGHAATLFESLTNPPAGFRIVFRRGIPTSEPSFYEIMGQSNLWRGKYATQLADLHNPEKNIQGGSLPNRQWVVSGGKTNVWNYAHRKQVLQMWRGRGRFPELSHGKLAGGQLWAFKVLSLGIAPVAPGTVELKGTNFLTFYSEAGAEHGGHFEVDQSGKLAAALLVIRNRGNVDDFHIQYTFQEDRFRGEFPSVIEVYRFKKLNERYEVLEYEPRGWSLPDSAFDIDGAGGELPF